MAARVQSSVRNRLLAVATAESFARLSPHLEFIELPVRAVLVHENVALEHVYFLESGLASMVATSRDGMQEIEVGHVGPEGMTGFYVLHGVDHTPHRTFMQTVGAAWRIPASLLVRIAQQDEALRNLLLRYIHCYELQLSHSALANGRYNINERLARWLLMSHDRLESDDLPLTHEFLSLMLGVRRSGVTNEIHVLEGAHLIRATRGRIHILDRRGLEEIAAGCYGIPEDEYERLILAPASRVRAGAKE
ncbi:Crp/Fnr family transcriptional regulator [Aureimonas sp. SK2]|uniref:Crp/Fnr family transcriptional regulator n=1 Tax=Aureimonas sp. SK2 TaxID=3015992 RepID=UPI002443F22B|nr:Crp/Fnr family transcriptional regulator [Aureimonas sp. SK2]